LPAAERAAQDLPVPTVEDATAARWDDLLAVFGTRGDPSRCWCQWFRHERPGFAATAREQRRTDLQAQLAGTPPPGVLVYDDEGVPCGWCAVAPRSHYPRFRSYPVAAGTTDADGLWTVTCFVVRVGRRRQGLAEVLLDGAVDLARRYGARTVEGHPVDTSVRTASAAELFHGPLSVFQRLGFTEVGARTSKARPVVRLALQEG
jgi:GNAT superfamily N-acetyltransferase